MEEWNSDHDLVTLRSLYVVICSAYKHHTNANKDLINHSQGSMRVYLEHSQFPHSEHLCSGYEQHMNVNNLSLRYGRVPWESIQNMASLHTLNLDHNLIDHIAEGSFGELYKLARLDMTSNRLRTLPPDPLFAR